MPSTTMPSRSRIKSSSIHPRRPLHGDGLIISYIRYYQVPAKKIVVQVGTGSPSAMWTDGMNYEYQFRKNLSIIFTAHSGVNRYTGMGTQYIARSYTRCSTPAIREKLAKNMKQCDARVASCFVLCLFVLLMRSTPCAKKRPDNCVAFIRPFLFFCAAVTLVK
jgi:hypothetical protein